MRLGALRIALIYVVFGVLWITLSDQFLSLFQYNVSASTFMLINSSKGITYVFITGLLLWKLIKRDDARLVKSEKQYRRMYEGNPLPMWIYDPDTLKFVSVNKTAVDSYGYTEADFLSKTILDIRPPEDREKVVESIQKVSNRIKQSGVWVHKKYDGTLMYVSISSQRVVFNNKPHVMVIAQDVNEHVVFEQRLKKLNNDLREKKSKLSETQQIARVAGWEYYLQDRQMLWSDEMYMLTDTMPEATENLYQKYFDMIHPDDVERLRSEFTNLINTGEELSFNHRLILNNGQTRYVRQLARLEMVSDAPFKITGSTQDITEYKLLELERNKYQYNLEDTLNTMSESFFALDKELYFIKVNAKFEEETGFSRELVIGKYLLDIFPEVKEDSACAKFRKVLADGQARKFEEYTEALGKWLSLAAYPTQDGLAIYFQDITEQKKKDIQLKQALERYNIVSKATNDVIYDYDMVHNNIIYNTSLTQLVNCDLRQINYDLQWWRSLIHPDDLVEIQNSQEKVLQNKETNWWCEYRVNCGNGEYKFVYDQGYFVYNDNEEPIRLIGAIKDIDELKRFDEENKRLAEIITKVNNMVVVMDRQDRVTWVNKAFEDYSQLGIENIIGCYSNEVLTDLKVSAQMLEVINERKARLETFAIEVSHHLHHDGRQWLEIEYTPLFDDSRKHTGYIAVHQNITSRKEKEDRVNQQNKTLQEIAWLSSHEVRRPVASILGLVYLAKDVQTEHERDEIIELINHCAQELDSIVHVISARVNEDIDLTSATNSTAGGDERLLN